jgi:hypothetical protein
MSYAIAASLQAVIYQHLSADAAVAGLVGSDIYDAVPPAGDPDLFVLIGDERVRDRSTKTSSAAYHDFVVSIATRAHGYTDAKELAAAICDSLQGDLPALSRGRLTGIWFRSARTRRGSAPDRRRIDLQFRAHVEDI